MQAAKSWHAAGKVYVWSVNDPDVNVDCTSASVNYVNRGSMQDASGKAALTWLENAELRKENGSWRIHFMQSTRSQ